MRKCQRVYECYLCEKIGIYDHANEKNGTMIKKFGDFQHKKCDKKRGIINEI